MRNSVYGALSQWARRTSSWAELRISSLVADEPHPADGLIYRLKYWPDLPDAYRTAPVYRALSVMSHRPVNRAWMLTHAGLQAEQLDRLMRRLENQEAVEVIDATRYQKEPAVVRPLAAPAQAHAQAN